MPAPGIDVCTLWKPTGHVRLRVGWLARIIAEVEETREIGRQYYPTKEGYRKSHDEYRWRRARPRDVVRTIERTRE